VTDGLGRQVHAATHRNDHPGWVATARTVRRFGIIRVGIEGASGYGAGLARCLTAAGIRVIDVPARVTVAGRKREAAGKSDAGDARVVARAVGEGFGSAWTYRPDLEALRVVSHRRDTLVRDQTRDTNRLRALLVDIDPVRASRLGRLRSTRGFDTLCRVRYGGDPHRDTAGTVIRMLAADCRRRLAQIRDLTRRLETLLPPAAHDLITRTDGLGVIGAAALLAELAGTDGFRTDAQFARWAGAAPLDASSGRQERHRLSRQGNRRVNRVLHTIIVTQQRHGTEAADYITRRRREGKTEREAIRAVKRHLARRLHKTLKELQLT
jgi:transposase